MPSSFLDHFAHAMTKLTSHSSTSKPFTPDSDDRRRPDPARPTVPSSWLATLKEAARNVGLIAALAGPIGLVGATMGLRIWGPPQEIAQLRTKVRENDSSSIARDSALSLRMRGVEISIADLIAEQRSIKEDITSIYFLQCETLRRTERGAPNTCFDILRRRGK